MGSKGSYDVIVAGAGPVGLFLASELGLTGLSVLVLERDVTNDGPWKKAPLGMRGMNNMSIEAVYRRGMLGDIFDINERLGNSNAKMGFGGKPFAGQYAGIMLDSGKMDLSRWKYRLEGPSLAPGTIFLNELEDVLEKRVASLGIPILRGQGVNKIIEETENSITVEAGEQNNVYQAKWLVGCDGGRSTVRRAAGFDFIGTDAKCTGYLATCEFDHPELLKPGFHVTNNGMYIAGQPGTIRLLDFDGGAFDRTTKVTKEHLQQVVRRVTGAADIQITSMDVAMTFTDRSKQTTSYRRGRVILAGDAAHIHSPMGGQGLNLGMCDAMNLGWKLAATIRQANDNQQVEDLTLLDTYEKERVPVGAAILALSRAQIASIEPGPYGEALRSVLRDLAATVDGTNVLIDRVWGLSLRYDSEDSHELVGATAPDFEFTDNTRLGSKLESGRGLLVDFSGSAALKALVAEGSSTYSKRVEYLSTDAKNRCGLQAVLIRPDGFVAWLAEENGTVDEASANAALSKWFSY